MRIQIKIRPAALAALAFSFVLTACGIFPEEIDVTADWSAARLYTEAKAAFDEKNWGQALKYYQKLESRYPYGRYAQQAQMETAYAHWKDGDVAAALADCDRFIKLHPNHPNVDYLYYLKGLISFNGDLGYMGYFSGQDQSERDPKAALESFETLKELVARFPESKYAEDARLRLNYLINALAAHETHVARYYYQRGAYLAAANRSQYALRHYPGTPAQEEATYLLMMSYEKLGIEELRADAERIMRLNYPNSLFLTQGLKKPKTWWQIF
ncbi:MAG: outer membrane protein assembly factor BamD [Zoogloeaceae bacterium]|jgi:outer membrane protein assembly factor BamD|nr:outer membrane protein assembly factor BamD [Zoogloeaceae bacterium]